MDLSVNNDSMLSPLQTGTALRTLFGLSHEEIWTSAFWLKDACHERVRSRPVTQEGRKSSAEKTAKLSPNSRSAYRMMAT